EEVDHHHYQAMHVLDYSLGRAAGLALGSLARVAVPTTVVGTAALDRVDPGIAARLEGGVADELTGVAEGPGQALVVEHPALVQHAIDGGGGVIDGLGSGLLGAPIGFTPTNRDGARDLAALYGGEGTPTVRRVNRSI